MFAETGPELRQGDICAIGGLPVWNVEKTSEVRTSSELVALQLPLARSFEAPDGRRLVMVCSHSCDIENPRQRTGLLVAPLIKVPANQRNEPERWTAITSSQTPNAQDRMSYVHLFPVELPAHLGGEWAVVDFSSLTAMVRAHAAHAILLSGKQAELTAESRRNLQIKLAVYVGAAERAEASAATPGQLPFARVDSE